MSKSSRHCARSVCRPKPAGFTDHVFALCHLLGFRFAPRIRDLADRRIYVPGKGNTYPSLGTLVGGTLNVALMATQWKEVLRLATSIKQGTVTASLILRKLGAYPCQNSLALALRELGRIERTLFTLEWLQSPELHLIYRRWLLLIGQSQAMIQ